jgi:hypothetical protein
MQDIKNKHEDSTLLRLFYVTTPAGTTYVYWRWMNGRMQSKQMQHYQDFEEMKINLNSIHRIMFKRDSCLFIALE